MPMVQEQNEAKRIRAAYERYLIEEVRRTGGKGEVPAHILRTPGIERVGKEKYKKRNFHEKKYRISD